jgi:hypothetical protein
MIMDENRRNLLKAGVMLAPAAILGLSAAASAEERSGAAALTALGLDPYVVYRKMFSSMVPGAAFCWWYLGATTTPVEGLGNVATNQVETIMVFKTEDLGPDAVRNSWLEIGCYRDIATGEMPTAWTNPITGKTEPRVPSFEDGPAHYTVRRAKDDVDIALEQAHAGIKQVRAIFTVEGDRVCLTQIEDKTRGVDTPKPLPVQTVLKVYASLADVKDPSQSSVAASGFYGLTLLGSATPTFAINGLMRKTATDEKLNPIAWSRMKAAYPAMFKGDRIDPVWK